MKTIRLLLLVLLPWMSFAMPPPAGGANRAVNVATTKVVSQQAAAQLKLLGHLRAKQSLVLASQVAGRIARLQVNPSEAVDAGALLIQLEDGQLAALVAEANAYLADEQRKLAELNRLIKRGAATQTELDAQQAKVAMAKARLTLAQENLADLTLRAPFAGEVGLFDLSVGQIISANQQLLTLDDTSLMELDVAVPEQYLAQLTTGLVAQASSSAYPQQSFAAKVVAVDSRVNTDALTIGVRLQLENPQRLLKPGMLMQVQLHVALDEQLLIPATALEYAGSKRFVYVVEDDKARRVEVTLGARLGNQVVVEQGLTAGDEIVSQGLVSIKDGASIQRVAAIGVADVVK